MHTEAIVVTICQQERLFFVQCGKCFYKRCGQWSTRTSSMYGRMSCSCETACLRKKNTVFSCWGTQTRSSFVGVDNFVLIAAGPSVIRVSGAACFIVSLNDRCEQRGVKRKRWFFGDRATCLFAMYAHQKSIFLDPEAPKRCPRLFLLGSCRLQTVNCEF